MPRTITPQQLGAALALRDLSDPADGPHAMQLVAAAITDALAARWRCPVVVHRAGPVVTVAENYELLGYPPDAATRDARYTRYVDDTHLLRSHTSAMVPAALRRLAGRDEDVVVACPGPGLPPRRGRPAARRRAAPARPVADPPRAAARRRATSSR